jgi:hypothetical protein
MFLAAANKIRNLLHLSFIGPVTVADLNESQTEVRT